MPAHVGCEQTLHCKAFDIILPFKPYSALLVTSYCALQGSSSAGRVGHRYTVVGNKYCNKNPCIYQRIGS